MTRLNRQHLYTLVIGSIVIVVYTSLLYKTIFFLEQFILGIMLLCFC